MQRSLHVAIPARKDVPETKLFVKIVATDEGSLKAKPYLFMLPGGPGFNHSHYKDYEKLKDKFNVVFHDPRGCGLSDKGDSSTYNMDNYIQDVECIRQHLLTKENLPVKDIHVLGKSYGAMCALVYALRYPANVDKLVLAAGSPSFKFLQTAQANFQARERTEKQTQLGEVLFAGKFTSDEHFKEFIDTMAPFYSWKKRHGETTNRPTPDYIVAAEPANRGFGGFMRVFDVENELAKVACETLILVGEEDWITDKQHSQLMADRIPGSNIIIFPKSDHSMESDVPEQYFSQISTFLSNTVKKKLNNRFFTTPDNSIAEQEPCRAFLARNREIR